MTGLLVLIAIAAVLIVTLEVTHRRASLSSHPGQDLAGDRDYQRVRGELRAAAQVERGSARRSAAPNTPAERRSAPRIAHTHHLAA